MNIRDAISDEARSMDIPEELHHNNRRLFKCGDKEQTDMNDLKSLSEEAAADPCSFYAALLSNRLRSLDEESRDYAMVAIDRYLFLLKRRRGLYSL